MLNRVGNYLAEISDAPNTRFVFVLFAATLTAALEYFVHYGLEWLMVDHQTANVIDATIIGLFAGVITYVEVKSVQARRHKILRDVQTVSSLNHHVRNALQAIQYAARLPLEEKQIAIIDESVEKIDKTLRELYPIITTEGALREADMAHYSKPPAQSR
ncbi:MAG TPA: hypothetical protein VN622_12965 [Clostridia bacterium]|nr:hypothetical protein [Clostridia bacterium]